jgi:hypothetical protein
MAKLNSKNWDQRNQSLVGLTPEHWTWTGWIEVQMLFSSRPKTFRRVRKFPTHTATFTTWTTNERNGKTFSRKDSTSIATVWLVSRWELVVHFTNILRAVFFNESNMQSCLHSNFVFILFWLRKLLVKLLLKCWWKVHLNFVIICPLGGGKNGASLP